MEPGDPRSGLCFAGSALLLSAFSRYYTVDPERGVILRQIVAGASCRSTAAGTEANGACIAGLLDDLEMTLDDVYVLLTGDRRSAVGRGRCVITLTLLSWPRSFSEAPAAFEREEVPFELARRQVSGVLGSVLSRTSEPSTAPVASVSVFPPRIDVRHGSHLIPMPGFCPDARPCDF